MPRRDSPPVRRQNSSFEIEYQSSILSIPSTEAAQSKKRLWVGWSSQKPRSRRPRRTHSGWFSRLSDPLGLGLSIDGSEFCGEGLADDDFDVTDEDFDAAVEDLDPFVARAADGLDLARRDSVNVALEDF